MLDLAMDRTFQMRGICVLLWLTVSGTVNAFKSELNVFRDKRQNSFPDKQVFDLEMEDIKDELKSWKHMKFDFLSQIRTLNENVATIEAKCNSVTSLNLF